MEDEFNNIAQRLLLSELDDMEFNRLYDCLCKELTPIPYWHKHLFNGVDWRGKPLPVTSDEYEAHIHINKARDTDNLASRIKELTAALTLPGRVSDKTRANALHARGFAYILDDQYENAITDFSTTLSMGSYVTTLYWRAQAYTRAGKCEEAIADIAAGLLSPDLLDDYYRKYYYLYCELLPIPLRLKHLFDNVDWRDYPTQENCSATETSKEYID